MKIKILHFSKGENQIKLNNTWLLEMAPDIFFVFVDTIIVIFMPKKEAFSY